MPLRSAKPGMGLATGGALVDAPLRGIGYMLLGGLLLTVNDATMKWLSGNLEVAQIIASRGLVALVLIWLVLQFRGRLTDLKVRHVGAQALRAALMIVSTFLFVTGLRWLPLADAVALAFIGPILVTALAPPLLGETVGWRRWSAVLIGFAGVILMVRPDGSAMNWAALLPLGAALAGALRDVLTRRMAATDSSVATLFYSTFGVTLAGALMLPFQWQPPQVSDIGFVALAGILLAAAHFLHIETFRFAEAAVVVPFKYASLLWAGLLGFAIWGHVPAPLTVTGAALVMASGLYILHRERRRVRLATASSLPQPIRAGDNS